MTNADRSAPAMIDLAKETIWALSNAWVLDDRITHNLPAQQYSVFFIRAANEAVAAGMIFG